MTFQPEEEIPLMLWKNSIHHKVREFCSIVERTPYMVIVPQIDELKALGMSYPALSLVDSISRRGYFDKDQYELEAELGRYWRIHPEDNTIEVFPFTPAMEERDLLPEVSQLLKHILFL